MNDDWIGILIHALVVFAIWRFVRMVERMEDDPPDEQPD